MHTEQVQGKKDNEDNIIYRRVDINESAMILACSGWLQTTIFIAYFF